MQQSSLSSQLVAARKQKGLTQEDLAGLTNLTVRTIQRIESGDSQPRSFTLKAIATALDLPFETLVHPHPVALETVATNIASDASTTTASDAHHVLQLLCFSCFSYIVVPYVHFLIPAHLLKKQGEMMPQYKAFAQKLVRGQIAWMVSFHLSLLVILGYNLLQAAYGSREYVVNYVWVVLVMYALNAGIITTALWRARQLAVNPATA